MDMEHFINIVFWIATLSGCLQANPIHLDSRISDMENNVKCPTDSKFYAPENVKVECISKALNCVMSELEGTVKEECEDPKGYIDQQLDHFDQMINTRPELGHALNNTECLCERWSETPFSEFLKKTETLLELINSAS